MKYLLIITLVWYGLSFWAFKAADRPGDDFGAAFPAIICGAVSMVLTIVYVALVFWNHRFL